MFSRILGYSIKNIFRNKFLSLSSVLVLTLLVFFINLLLVIQNISFNLIDNVNEKLTISLYLEEKYDKNSKDVNLLINSIEDL
jgi:cell division protein FtsX